MDKECHRPDGCFGVTIIEERFYPTLNKKKRSYGLYTAIVNMCNTGGAAEEQCAH